MNRRPDPRRIEILDGTIVEILRAKTTAERVGMIASCHQTMRRLLEGHLRTRHPDWDDAALHAEIARRMSRGTGCTP